ncbi:MAG TPA: isochorismatase family protein [Micromonosporaceae bacterium]
MTGQARLDPRTTALVLIDLQRGVVEEGLGAGIPFAPHKPADVVANARRLALTLSGLGGTVIMVRGSMGIGGPPPFTPTADVTFPAGPVDPRLAELVPDLADLEAKHVVKHQWGSFYGTDLEPQLRGRGIDTLLFGGVATNLGVEAAAREAHDRGFEQILVEDATTAFDGRAHQDSIDRIFRLIGRVRSTQQVVAALEAGADQ